MWNKKIPNYQLIQVLLDRTTTDDCESRLSLIYIFFSTKQMLMHFSSPVECMVCTLEPYLVLKQWLEQQCDYCEDPLAMMDIKQNLSSPPQKDNYYLLPGFIK